MGELEGMKRVLLDQEDGELLLDVEGADDLENLPGDERGEPERRLVEQQEARPAHERARDRQHLLLAARERAAALVEPLAQPRKQDEDAVEIGVEIAALAEGCAHLQVLQDAHAHEDAAALRRLRDLEARDL